MLLLYHDCVKIQKSFEKNCCSSVYSNTVCISGGDNGKLIEIDGSTGIVLSDYAAHSGSVNVVRRRDHNTFVSAGFDGKCRVSCFCSF